MDAVFPQTHSVRWLIELKKDKRKEIIPHIWQQGVEVLLNWILSFLCKPNAALTRSTPVCPFLHGAIRADCLFVTLTNSDYFNKAHTAHFRDLQMTHYRQVINLRDSSLASGIYLLGHELDHAILAKVRKFHQQEKASYVESGLMIGEFYRDRNPPTGQEDMFFWPPESPHPLIAVRKLRPTDAKFVINNPSYFDSFNRYYGSAAPSYIKAYSFSAI